MDNNKYELIHWNFFIALEEELEHASRYIEFCEDNYNVFSVELSHLLLSSTSEFEVVMKQLCLLLDPSFDTEHSGINNYCKVIKEKLNYLLTETVYINRYSLQFNPFDDWEESKIPFWWNSYNKIKHHRYDYYSRADLKNVLNSMSALLITIFYYYRLVFIKTDSKFEKNMWVTFRLSPISKLLRLDGSYYFGIYQDYQQYKDVLKNPGDPGSIR